MKYMGSKRELLEQIETIRNNFVQHTLYEVIRVETLGDLVQFNKTDLLKFRNFGKKSLTELDDLLESLNLTFGTDISKYKLEKE